MRALFGNNFGALLACPCLFRLGQPQEQAHCIWLQWVCVCESGESRILVPAGQRMGRWAVVLAKLLNTVQIHLLLWNSITIKQWCLEKKKNHEQQAKASRPDIETRVQWHCMLSSSIASWPPHTGNLGSYTPSFMFVCLSWLKGFETHFENVSKAYSYYTEKCTTIQSYLF